MDTYSDISEHKIMAMDEEKRQRILNAAMEEFTKGYDAASTDTIVREAGISKGLLFHYFGTKKGLYLFVIDYALETIVSEYSSLINIEQGNILDRLWQMSLLKRDLTVEHPKIFEFLTSAYYISKDEPNGEFAERFSAIQAKTYAALYSNIDRSLLKEGVDKVMASNVIRWTLAGLSEQITGAEKPYDELTSKYDEYLEETKKYLDLLRQMLYRQ